MRKQIHTRTPHAIHMINCVVVCFFVRFSCFQFRCYHYSELAYIIIVLLYLTLMYELYNKIIALQLWLDYTQSESYMCILCLFVERENHSFRIEQKKKDLWIYYWFARITGNDKQKTHTRDNSSDISEWKYCNFEFTSEKLLVFSWSNQKNH